MNFLFNKANQCLLSTYYVFQLLKGILRYFPIGQCRGQAVLLFHDRRTDDNSKQLLGTNSMPGTVVSALGFVYCHTQNSPVG